jgi:gamma-glutamyltranspeptidase/glutathione hydrolase
MSDKANLSRPHRPNIVGTRHVVASGHYMASLAAFEVLEAGGNAIDAGVAAGLATDVLESGYASFGGVAPIMIYLAESQEVLTISGLGTWPKAASWEFFQKHHDGAIPTGILSTVVPAAPDAWVTALEKYGTMSFGEVAATAIRLARDGFPMYPRMAELIRSMSDGFKEWPGNMEIFFPNGRAPEVGEIFLQTDTAKTLQFLADEEAANSKGGREQGLQAVRDAFYRGDIADMIVRHQHENGGLLAAEDMAEFRVAVEPPVRTRFGDIDIFACGPWCQGPMLLQELNLLEAEHLRELGHNSTAYIHTLIEAIKLSAADRNAYYGDPRFVDVPMDELLSESYAAERRKMIRPDQAWPDMPPAGKIAGANGSNGKDPSWKVASGRSVPKLEDDLDTSYLCVVDSHGNAFSSTPSDGMFRAPVVPGTGIVPCPRGRQSWADPDHPSCLAPGKRPRLTPNPGMAIREGKWVMPFGSPGNDRQTQAMLQVFLNLNVFDMDPQTAVEAPRFVSYSFPATTEPHESYPGRLCIEGNIAREIGDALGALGHKIKWWPERRWTAGSVCAIRLDTTTGVLTGAADPRRTAYAIGW